MEAVAQADTIVFDKTGTLTKSQPRVAEVVTFGGSSRDEMLRTAACLEEHFPHSIAMQSSVRLKKKSYFIRKCTRKSNMLSLTAFHLRLMEKKAVIGSYHFVFEDEQCRVPENEQEKFDALAQNCFSFVFGYRRRFDRCHFNRRSFAGRSAGSCSGAETVRI